MFDTVGRLFSTAEHELFDMNKATLSGCVDIIVVKKSDGSFKSTPFHLRFGKLKILYTKGRLIEIWVNGKLTHLKMKLGETGEGYFEEIIFENQLKQKELPDDEELDIPNDNGFDTFGQKKIATPRWVVPPSDKQDSIKQDKQTSEVGAGGGFMQSDAPKYEVSLCGDPSFFSQNALSQAILFQKQKISQAEFDAQPDITSNPRLVLRVGDHYLPWATAARTMISSCAFGTPSSPLIENNIINLATQSMSSPTSFSRTLETRIPIRAVTVKKSIRPSSEGLLMLGLKPGVNSIKFIVKDDFGDQSIEGFIYLWDENKKIVISDVDGTITKSDVLGYILPLVGKDWSHPGIVSLYRNIERNGYQILYLTARAIGQADFTRRYLSDVTQDGEKLPEGPLITSPDRLMNSFRREMIQRRPELFKIAALRDVQSLFGNKQPFVAGFGNRDTDAYSYRAVGIELQSIFIINPKSEIHQLTCKYKKTYRKLNKEVDKLFPPTYIC